MPDFPIVDSHVHLYDPAWLRYPWMDGDPVLDRPHGMAELDAARGPVAVEALVFVEVAADRGLHLAEAAWIEGLAAADPRIAAIVAHAPVERGAAVDADLDRLAPNGRLRGIRRLIQAEPDPGFCLEPGFVEGVRRVGSRGLAFDLCVKPWQMTHAVELARRCEGVRLVLDHVGKPPVRHGFWEPWAGELRRMAALPHVACKLSGVITEADHAAWTEDVVRPYLLHALDCFGPGRCLFGSDWPVSSLTHGYPRWVAVVEAALAGCTEAERRAVFGGNARAVYRI